MGTQTFSMIDLLNKVLASTDDSLNVRILGGGVTIEPGDIEIGAVEIKNSTDDTRLALITKGSTITIPTIIVDASGNQVTTFGTAWSDLNKIKIWDGTDTLAIDGSGNITIANTSFNVGTVTALPAITGTVSANCTQTTSPWVTSRNWVLDYITDDVGVYGSQSQLLSQKAASFELNTYDTNMASVFGTASILSGTSLKVDVQNASLTVAGTVNATCSGTVAVSSLPSIAITNTSFEAVCSGTVAVTTLKPDGTNTMPSLDAVGRRGYVQKTDGTNSETLILMGSYYGGRVNPQDTAGSPLFTSQVSARKTTWSSSTVCYSGWAVVGVITSAASWRVRKRVFSNDDFTDTWADGNSNYDNVWDNYLILSYS